MPSRKFLRMKNKSFIYFKVLSPSFYNYIYTTKRVFLQNDKQNKNVKVQALLVEYF